MATDELHLDAQELRRLLEFTNRPNVQDQLRKAIEEIEERLAQSKPAPASAGPSDTDVDSSKTKSGHGFLPVAKIKTYGWDQSEKFVKLYITLKGVHTLPKENVVVEYTPVSFKLFVKNLNNKNMELIIQNLAKSIDAKGSSYKVKSDEIVLSLRKADSGSWSALTKSEVKAKEKPPPKFNENEDPSTGIMNIMKQMYEEGDDEMKKTIEKAWTEGRNKSAAGMY